MFAAYSSAKAKAVFQNNTSYLKYNMLVMLPLASLLSTRFPTAGLKAAHFREDWLLNRSLAAKWAPLLITHLAAAYPAH